MFGCARPLCTGTFTGPVEAGAVTVVLFPADGFLPPLLMHWYVAVAVDEQVAGVDETLPRPETSPLQTSCPWLFTLNETLLKLAAATAVAAPNTSSPVTARMSILLERSFIEGSFRVCESRETGGTDTPVYRRLALLFVFRMFRPAPHRRRFRKMQAGSAPLVQRRARSGVRRPTVDARGLRAGGARAQAPAADALRIHADRSGAVKATATWLTTAIRRSTASDA